MNNTKLALAFLNVYLIAAIISCFPFSKHLMKRKGYKAVEAKPYINQFKKDLNIDKITVNVYIINVSFNNQWTGKCYYLHNTVIIDKQKWNDLGPNQKKWVIYHEYGHCRYAMKHEKPKKVSWYNRDHLSLMHPTIPPENFFTKRRWTKMLSYFKGKIYAR